MIHHSPSQQRRRLEVETRLRIRSQLTRSPTSHSVQSEEELRRPAMCAVVRASNFVTCSNSDVYKDAATKRNAFIFYDDLKINQAYSVSTNLMPRLIRSGSHSRRHNPDSRYNDLQNLRGTSSSKDTANDKIFINIRSVFFPEI